MSTGTDGTAVVRTRRPPEACRRPGRQCDPNRDADIMAAALELLAETGYDRLTMEAVASRARAGKATLYRRWSSKAELVVDAVSCLQDPASSPLVVDTGSLRGDLRAAFLNSLNELDDFRVGLMSGLMTALRRDPDLAAAFERRFVAHKMAALKRIFERAADRGEVAPGHDVELLASVGPAILFHRLLLTGKPLTRHFVTKVIDEVVVPLAGARIQRKAKS